MMNEMENSKQIKLKECLTIQEVSGMTHSIKTIFDSGMSLLIDVSDIQRIDGAGLQLLSAIVKEANDKMIDITWKGYSKAFNDAVLHYGLNKIINLSTV
jgi:anti-anti-sigma regulatory factor